MLSRYEVKLNNVSMASLSDKILLLDVRYEPPQYARNLFQRANRHGALAGNPYKERAAVSVLFEIREYGIVERQSILADVVRWARDGGELRINDRPEQKLVCICEELPAIESVRDWTSELTITFAAYAIPYWQSLTPLTYTAQLVSGETADYDDDAGFVTNEITINGNAPYAFLDVELQVPEDANSGNRIEIENDLSPEGRFILSNETGSTSPNYIKKFVIETDEKGILRTYKYTLNLDTGDYENVSNGVVNKGKNDEIRLIQNKVNTVRIRYGQYYDNTFTPYAATVTLKVRGLWE